MTDSTASWPTASAVRIPRVEGAVSTSIPSSAPAVRSHPDFVSDNPPSQPVPHMLRAILMPSLPWPFMRSITSALSEWQLIFAICRDHGLERALHRFFQKRNLDRINLLDGVECCRPQIVSLLPELRKANHFDFPSCHRIFLFGYETRLTGNRTLRF